MWVILLGVACSKSSEDGLLMKDVHDRSMNSSVTNLSYGEEVFYIKNQRSGNTVSPVSRPSFDGHFTAIPAGLAINRYTGSIDLQNSESGQAYKIFYVNAQGVLKDSVRIIISGVGYQDGVYSLESLSSSFGQTAYPTYNGGQHLPESLVNNFSAADDDEDLEVSNSSKKLTVHKFSGEIDLKKSVENGFFGSSLSNGKSERVAIRYRIADKSARKMNKVNLRIYYFENESKVPGDLKRVIAERKMIMDRVNKMPNNVGKNTSEDEVPQDEVTEETLSDFNKPVRPPLIIVVG